MGACRRMILHIPDGSILAQARSDTHTTNVPPNPARLRGPSSRPLYPLSPARIHMTRHDWTLSLTGTGLRTDIMLRRVLNRRQLVAELFLLRLEVAPVPRENGRGFPSLIRRGLALSVRPEDANRIGRP